MCHNHYFLYGWEMPSMPHFSQGEHSWAINPKGKSRISGTRIRFAPTHGDQKQDKTKSSENSND